MSGSLFETPELGPSTMTLRQYQADAIDAARECLKTSRSTLVLLPTGTGKCLAKGTAVLMYDGSTKTVEDVQVGDRLMGPDSTPRTVLSTCTGREMMYRVVPTKGDPYVVNESHVLSLKYTNDGSRNAGQIIDISVRDYLRASNTFRHCTKGYRVGVDFPASTEPLRLEPYFLGVWLGDGVSRTQTVVSTDVEVIEYLSEHAERRSLRLSARSYGDRITEYTAVGVKRKPNVVKNALRSYGLIQNKHVPVAFKCGPRDVRLQVLAGLIDTDGELTCNGYSLTFKSRRLAEDTAFLARSLGFAAYLRERICRCTNGRPGHSGVYHKVSISGHCDAIPVRIQAKKAQPRRQKKDVLVHGITVEPVGEGAYYGFEIDGDRRFLLGDFTVTHNTVLFCGAARMTAERGGRTLILVGREELAYQTGNMLERFGLAWGLEKADSSARQHGEPHVVVAMVQTLHAKRLQKWPADYFRLIVIDECHHAVSESHQRILKHFRVGGKPVHRVGVTATPDRNDEQKVADVFATKAYEMDIWDAIKSGFLAPLRFLRCDTPLDLRGLKSGKEDYSDADVAARITPMVEVLANAIKAKVEGRQTIVFTPDCKSASAVATALQSLNCNADYVTGQCQDRPRKIESYIKGETRILVNAMLLTEGFDAPHTSAIVLLRPTKSRSLYSQMVGRGTRLAPMKDHCLIVDFPCLTDELDLVRPLDMLFAKKAADEEDDIMDELIQASPEGIDLIEAAERAGKEKARRDEMRIQVRQREDKLKWTTKDPLEGAFDLLGVPYKASAHAIHAKPSQRVVETLTRMKIPNADKLSRGNAKRILDELSERRRKGLASYAQTRTLARNQVPIEVARAMSFDQAKVHIDEIAKRQGWGSRQVAV